MYQIKLSEMLEIGRHINTYNTYIEPLFKRFTNLSNKTVMNNSAIYGEDYFDPFNGNDFGDEQDETLVEDDDEMDDGWGEDDLMTRRWEEAGEQGNELPFEAPSN